MGEMKTVKLWFKIVMGRGEDASGEDVVDAVVEVEMRADVYRAIAEGRASIRDFKVIGGE